MSRARWHVEGVETVKSGCHHWSGDPDDERRDRAIEAAARSEGSCGYCREPLEVLPIGPYCNCCHWYWLPRAVTTPGATS